MVCVEPEDEINTHILLLVFNRTNKLLYLAYFCPQCRVYFVCIAIFGFVYLLCICHRLEYINKRTSEATPYVKPYLSNLGNISLLPPEAS